MGQDTLKRALLLNAVDPRVGGVLVRGEKGTAKSTAVRALATVLPEIDVVEGCRFSCDPADPGSWCVECRERREDGTLPKTTRRPRVVDLPVSATEDRLVGTLDIEHALKHGERVFEPGLLAAAHRGILYVDEVNLLDDHLVDTLLDAAAMGVNTVEREGISFTHPARFILVGTMNPEEGDIRPQLLDRFGLCVDVTGVKEPTQRLEILKRRRAFDDDAAGFLRDWMTAEDEILVQLKHARLRLPTVTVDDRLLSAIADVCARAGVDGHRADLVLSRAAASLTALDGRKDVTAEDVRTVAALALTHRMRRRPFEETEDDQTRMAEAMTQALGSTTGDGVSDSPGGSGDGSEALLGVRTQEPASETPILPLDPLGDSPLDRARRSVSGRRQESVSSDGRGRYTRAEASASVTTDIALDATLRAAAPHQRAREGELAINLDASDMRTKVRMRRVGASIVFCVDGSGSMGAAERMGAAKAAVLEMLVDAYRRRDRVGLVSFRGTNAEVVLPPTASVELAQVKLRQLATGGATPLADGLVRSLELLDSERRRDPETVPWLVLVTDGRANVGLNGGLGSEDARTVASRIRMSSVRSVVLDTGSSSSVTGSAARDIARVAGAEYVRLATMNAQNLADVVRSRINAS